MTETVSAQPLVWSFPSTAEVSSALAAFVSRTSDQAIKAHGRFTVALSGGSLPKILAAALKSRQDVDWSRWHVFYADERCVPLDHEDSNHFLCKKELLDFVPIPKDQIVPINPDLIKDPAAAARDYQARMAAKFSLGDGHKYPAFDLILLGIGPDGHTCSLFPEHALLKERELWVASILDSPKPPPARITLTFPVLNAARAAAFVATGAGKKEMLARILDENDRAIPASLVKPVQGQVHWFLDDAASANLKAITTNRPMCQGGS